MKTKTKMKSLAVACLLGLVVAKNSDWNYADNQGADWGVKYSTCNNPGGSPIDLKKDFTAAGYKQHDVNKMDKPTSSFANQSG